MTLARINSNQLVETQPQAIGDLIADYVLVPLSEASRRVYTHTYQQWMDFAEANSFDPLALTYDHVKAFVNQTDVAKSTRQNRLSHLRKLLRTLSLEVTDSPIDYDREYNRVLAHLKVTLTDSDRKRRGHSQRALTDPQLTQVLNVWRYDTRRVGLRNNALIRLLIFTGLRRNELAQLRWSDIDLDKMTLTVRHGKGDKIRAVAILDGSAVTKLALEALAEAQKRHTPDTDYDHVFCRMTHGRNPHFGADTAIDSETVAVVVKLTASKSRVGHFSPHDLRRSHITSYLDRGATLAEAQAQAGHSNPATTLIYAQATDAEARGKRIRLNVS